MKSAYELAMERLEKESPSRPPLTNEQKAEIAEIENRYQAKIAEKKILAEEEIAKAAGNPSTIEAVQAQLQKDISRLEAERDKKKEEVRQQDRS